MPPKPTRTVRDLTLASWAAALRQADHDGYVVLTAASFAGYALLIGGDVYRARAMIPGERESSGFWAEVHERIDSVATEEMVHAEVASCR